MADFTIQDLPTKSSLLDSYMLELDDGSDRATLMYGFRFTLGAYKSWLLNSNEFTALVDQPVTETSAVRFSKAMIGSTAGSGAIFEVGGGYNYNKTTGSNQLAFLKQDSSSANQGYRHFIQTQHDDSGAALSGKNRINYFVNTSTTPTGSSSPGVGNVSPFAITDKGNFLNGYPIFLTDNITKNYIGYGANTGLLPKNWGISGLVAGGTDGGALIQTFTDEVVARWTAASRFYTCNETHFKLAEGQPDAFLAEYEISPWYDTDNDYLKIRTRLADDVDSNPVYTNDTNVGFGKISATKDISSQGKISATQVTSGAYPDGIPDWAFNNPGAVLFYNNQTASDRIKGFGFVFQSGTSFDVPGVGSDFSIGFIGIDNGSGPLYSSTGLMRAAVVYNSSTNQYEYRNLIVETGLELYETDVAIKSTTSTWQVPSDENLKDPLVQVDASESRRIIEQLPACYYTHKDSYAKSIGEDCKNKPRHIGLGARHVETLIPDAVSTDGDGNKTINYHHIYKHMLNVVRELSLEMKELKKKLY